MAYFKGPNGVARSKEVFNDIDDQLNRWRNKYTPSSRRPPLSTMAGPGGSENANQEGSGVQGQVRSDTFSSHRRSGYDPSDSDSHGNPHAVQSLKVDMAARYREMDHKFLRLEDAFRVEQEERKKLATTVTAQQGTIAQLQDALVARHKEAVETKAKLDLLERLFHTGFKSSAGSEGLSSLGAGKSRDAVEGVRLSGSELVDVLRAVGTRSSSSPGAASAAGVDPTSVMVSSLLQRVVLLEGENSQQVNKQAAPLPRSTSGGPPPWESQAQREVHSTRAQVHHDATHGTQAIELDGPRSRLHDGSFDADTTRESIQQTISEIDRRYDQEEAAEEKHRQERIQKIEEEHQRELAQIAEAEAQRVEREQEKKRQLEQDQAHQAKMTALKRQREEAAEKLRLERDASELRERQVREQELRRIEDQAKALADQKAAEEQRIRMDKERQEVEVKQQQVAMAKRQQQERMEREENERQQLGRDRKIQEMAQQKESEYRAQQQDQALQDRQEERKLTDAQQDWANKMEAKKQKERERLEEEAFQQKKRNERDAEIRAQVEKEHQEKERLEGAARAQQERKRMEEDARLEQEALRREMEEEARLEQEQLRQELEEEKKAALKKQDDMEVTSAVAVSSSTAPSRGAANPYDDVTDSSNPTPVAKGGKPSWFDDSDSSASRASSKPKEGGSPSPIPSPMVTPREQRQQPVAQTTTTTRFEGGVSREMSAASTASTTSAAAPAPKKAAVATGGMMMAPSDSSDDTGRQSLIEKATSVPLKVPAPAVTTPVVEAPQPTTGVITAASMGFDDTSSGSDASPGAGFTGAGARDEDSESSSATEDPFMARMKQHQAARGAGASRGAGGRARGRARGGSLAMGLTAATSSAPTQESHGDDDDDTSESDVSDLPGMGNFGGGGGGGFTLGGRKRPGAKPSTAPQPKPAVTAISADDDDF